MKRDSNNPDWLISEDDLLRKHLPSASLKRKDMEKERLCKNCIWVNSQANESGMIHCKFLNCAVYGDSQPCAQFELYDPENRPF